MSSESKRLIFLVALLMLLTLVRKSQAVEPILWLDASDSKQLSFSQGKLARWSDKSKSAAAMRQSEFARQPTKGAALNQRNTLHFDGDDFLAGPAVLSEGNDRFTMIALWKPSRIAIQAIVEQAGAGSGRRASLLQVNGAYGFNGQNNDFHNAVPLQAKQWRLTAIVLNGRPRNNVVVIDNNSAPKVGTVDIERQNVGVDGIRIGRKLTANGEYFQGDLAEIRLFNQVLSSQELRQQLRQIQQRWGVNFDSQVPQDLAAAAAPAPKAAMKLNTKPTTQQVAFFENKVRPLLSEHCYECHSGNAKRIEAGLRLDGNAWGLKGGDSGPAIAPGDAPGSLLIQAVKWESFEMPPKGKLSESQIATLSRWIEMGAPWPGLNPSVVAEHTAEEPYDWERIRKEHWSFRPIAKPSLPPLSKEGWARGPIDQLVFRRLKDNQLTPNRPADKPTLIRRLYFDLLGLPPKPQDVRDFVNDDRPQAFAELVDRLLESENYGERWGRYWLDVARYSDGMGGFLDNAPLPNAWRYRDWVVNAFNQDMPYNEFVQRQIAGDLEPWADPVATGFFAVGPTYRGDGGDPEATAQAKAETLSDRVDTFSRAFLGLTAACARCHNHKFDPITTHDYYAIAGVFNNTRVTQQFVAAQVDLDAFKKAQQAVNEQNGVIKRFLDDHAKRLKVKGQQVETKLDSQQKAELAGYREQLKVRQQAMPPRPEEAHVLVDSGNADMHVAIRGDLRKRGEKAPRRFLQIVVGEDAPRFRNGSGRRELANAVVESKNPLTARVIVNRLWQWHFGAALVRSPSNFGALGETPTHPLLLDWLADNLIRNGWSLKKLHREILLSATWRMSSEFEQEKFERDGDNRLIWRMNPRKLGAEVWRDGLLAVTGELDRTLGGPPTSDILNSKRRTLYASISRNGDRFDSDEFLRLFDFPSPRTTSAQRSVSTVPQQYLFMMNSPFMIRRAEALVRDLEKLDGHEAKIREAYLRLYARPPEARELKIGIAFLGEGANESSKWTQYAQVLLSAHEFQQIR